MYCGYNSGVECHFAKVNAVGSNPTIRSKYCPGGEMVDTLALGASAAMRGGSSPSQGTSSRKDG
jgi:hypothetical protein